MIQTFKKFFIRLGKKLLWASFGLFLLGILLTPQPALAGVWDWIVGAVTALPAMAVILVFQLLILIFGSLSALAGTLLKWVLSPDFISWSYTNPANNPVIEIGYNITRSFVNMGLVLALVYIAFATILRLADYKAQKLLATLVIVALLVNFAPLICGLIVDAANIVMYYFTDHITGMKNLTNALTEVGNILKATFTDLEVFKISEQMGLVTQSLVLIFFNMALFFILLTFTFLFILRYVVIWILVILSPLAFVSRVLPATKKMFDMWWRQLIQWAIIGIIAGFFIYLGEQISNALSDPSVISFKLETDEYGIFDTVLPHIVTLAFLVIGFFLSLTTSAIGASQIMNFGQKAGMVIGKATGKFTGGAVRRIPAISRAEETVRRRLETTPVLSRMVGGVGAFEKGRQTKISSFEKQFEGLPHGELRRIFQQPAFTYDDTLKRAAIYKSLQKKGELGTGNAQQSAAERAYLPTARALGIDTNDILKRRPDWAPAIGQTVNEAMARIEPETFYKDVQREALSDPGVILNLLTDERKFMEFDRKAKSNKKQQVRTTIFSNPQYQVPPQHLPLVMQRVQRMSTHPNWRV